jgi:2'-5' RNA ligase
MRLFAAIEIPPEIRESLWGLTEGLPGADWVDPETYHITLRFIGDAGRAETEEIDQALSELSTPGFALSLAGVDFFQTAGRPRSLWAGVSRSPPLLQLARRIDRVIVEGGRNPEERAFTPHVTIARLSDIGAPQVMRFVGQHALYRSPPFAVDRFTLFESRQGKGGPAYAPLADYALGGAVRPCIF